PYTNMKRIFIIIIILILLMLLGIGAYSYLSGNKAATDGTGGSTGITFRDFIPFGGQKTPTPTPDTDINPPPDTNPLPLPPVGNSSILKQISPTPIAGYSPIIKTVQTLDGVIVTGMPSTTPGLKIENKPAVRYAEIATGHIDETYLDLISETKVTNT